MNHETVFYIFNENGFIEGEKLEHFCNSLMKKTMLPLKQMDKAEIDISGTVFKKIYSDKIDFLIYDHGYVMKIEGDIRQSILLMKEIDLIIDKHIIFFVSPSQRIENSEESKYPRGAFELQIAEFLDRQFRTTDYTMALA